MPDEEQFPKENSWWTLLEGVKVKDLSVLQIAQVQALTEIRKELQSISEILNLLHGAWIEK